MFIFFPFVCIGCPFARPDDGYLDVVIGHRKCFPSVLIDLLCRGEDGSVVWQPNMQYFRCKKVRFIPLTTQVSGWQTEMSIDGEHGGEEPVDFTVLEKCARFVT